MKLDSRKPRFVSSRLSLHIDIFPNLLSLSLNLFVLVYS